MMRPSKSQLRNFLFCAHRYGYASGNRGTLQKDGSRTIAYSQGNWVYQDNYFGGEPFGGREAVFFKGKPLFLMAYYGATVSREVGLEDVYSFLRKALCASPKSDPYRGPKVFRLGNLAYKNRWSGDIFGFSGKESIYQNGRKVYAGHYSGGLVCQNRQ